MTLFSDAISSGLANARTAELQREEIYNLVNQLSTDVLFATDNNVVVEWIVGTDKQGFLGRPPLPHLRARRTQGTGEGVKLATFVVPIEGYPVRLDYEDLSTSADDKDSLIENLREMLAHPAIGEKLHNLTKPQGLLGS